MERSIRYALGVAVLVGGAAGCVADDAITALEYDLGGPNGVMDLFQNNSEGEVREKLADYGIEYRTSDLISDCPKYFPASDRSFWQSFDGEFYYIESNGRPSRAYKYLPPIAAEARNDSCQAAAT